MAANPRYLDDALAAIAAELSTRPAYVYANRDKGFSWEGLPAPEAPEPSAAPDVAADAPAVDALATDGDGGARKLREMV